MVICNAYIFLVLENYLPWTWVDRQLLGILSSILLLFFFFLLFGTLLTKSVPLHPANSFEYAYQTKPSGKFFDRLLKKEQKKKKNHAVIISGHQLGNEVETDLLRGPGTCSLGQRAEGLVCMCILTLFKQRAEVCGRFWREHELWRHCQAAVASGTMWVAAYGHTDTTAICLLNLKWLPHSILCRVLDFKTGSIFTPMAFTDSTLQGQAVRVLLACFIWVLLVSFFCRRVTLYYGNTVNQAALWTFLCFPVLQVQES